MSKYTAELRFICESLAGLDSSQGFNSVDDIIKKARTKIFNFDYPIFDINYRESLECKILRHFYTREICEETFALWQLRLQQRLWEVMPYYNLLYKSELLQYNPFIETDFTVDTTINNKQDSKNDSTQTASATTSSLDKASSATNDNGTVANTSNSNSKTTTDNVHWDKYSNTPQGGLSGIDYDTYLTDARKLTDSNRTSVTNSSTDRSNTTSESSVVSNSDSSSESTNNVTNSATSKTTSDTDTKTRTQGKTSSTSYAKLLQEYRDTFLNVDKMLLDNLSDLFILLWE